MNEFHDLLSIHTPLFHSTYIHQFRQIFQYQSQTRNTNTRWILLDLLGLTLGNSSQGYRPTVSRETSKEKSESLTSYGYFHDNHFLSKKSSGAPASLRKGQTLMDIKRLPCEYYAGMVRTGRDVRIPRTSLPWSWILFTWAELLYFIGRALKTLFLFTKSDFKTIIAPVLVIILSLNTPSPLLILKSVFWTWLHVLQCALANQTLSPEEDALNKPDRPIPSGRISQQDARLLRWLCIIPCLALSYSYGITVFNASAWLSIFLYIYNELSFNAHWLSRNLLNGAGLACFEIGATLITADDHTCLTPAAVKAIILSTSVFVTTIHTQDFKDVLGDKEIGRTTLPIIFPKASRISILILLPLWSLSLQWLWNTNPLVSYLLVALSIIIGARFVFKTSIAADQRSFLLYNVWLCLTHLLPAL